MTSLTATWPAEEPSLAKAGCGWFECRLGRLRAVPLWTGRLVGSGHCKLNKGLGALY